MFLFQLATDAGEFKESEHPRKDNGQFGQGGGGAKPAYAAFKPYAASNHLHGALKANGFKKHKDAIPTYSHPSGAKVIIQPHPEGAAHSSVWQSHKPGFPVKSGSGIKEISQLLRFAVEKAEKKSAEAPKAPVAPPAPTAASGLLPSPVISTLPTAPGTYASVSGVLNAISGKGYEPAGHKDHTPGTAYYEKSDGSAIQYDPNSGDWIAQSKGHMTKEGNGLNNLETLLSGKPAVYEGGKAPWQNTSKTIGPKPEAPKDLPHEALRKKIAAVRPEPTMKEDNALGSYKGSGYSQINQGLRHNPSYADNSSDVKHIDSFLARGTIPEDVTLYRGVKGDYAKILKSVIMEGTKFVDRGFVSTSTNSGVAQGFASGLTFAIKVPKGSMGAAVRAASSQDGEHEILFPRNTAFIVKSYDPHSGHVEVELDQSHMKKVNA